MTSNFDLQRNVPEILRQKIIELDGTSKILIPSEDQKFTVEETFDNGRFLLWKGAETGLFFATGPVCPGSLYIFNYQNGTENANLVMDYKFGRTANIVDVLYFPLANGHRGIVVAVADRSMEENGNYLAYISLGTKSLLKSFAMPHPITKLCSIIDGTADRSEFNRLAPSFHNEWQNMLLVGCRFGYVSLIYLDINVADDRPSLDYLQNVNDSPTISKSTNEKTSTIRPVKLKKNVHLSKIFYNDKMFVFRADDGITRCHSKEKVHVSTLHWIHKSGLAIIGFNFGGIMVVSLRTSKVYSFLYIDGSVQQFALQEPEEDPRPILYLWISYNSLTIGTTLIMCTINFPKDEEAAKKSEQFTFLEPYFSPCMKWNPDNCHRLLTMRTINKRHIQGGGNGNDQPDASSHLFNPISSSTNGNGNNSILNEPNKDDTSLLFISWLERIRKGDTRIHGALFDLNAFYAKRLIPRIQPDSTIARQFPFIARFSTNYTDTNNRQNALLDINPARVSQFAPPAFLNETIDQLYYPSTYHLTLNCLSIGRVFQVKIQPIQVQLISNLVKNVAKYFDSPHDPVRWIHSIGLANSLPSNNINEKRACLLRVIVHSFFPGILSLIDSAAEQPEWLKFIQKWIWKEVEITKIKFDDLCSPLFSTPPHEPSPSAKGFIQHSRVFFKRASIIFEALNAKFTKLTESERSRSIVIQGKVARQVRLYSAGIAFALVYNLLPINKLNGKLYEIVFEQFARRAEKARRFGKELEIHSLIDEIIKSNQDEEIWQRKNAQEWYPPNDLKSFLPILLMVNITENAKLSLLGYYCLDLEIASLSLGPEIEAKDGSTPPTFSIRSKRTSNSSLNDTNISQPFRNQKFFSFFLAFFLQEDFTLDEMNRIKAIWNKDREAETEIISQSNVGQQKEGIDSEHKLKWSIIGNSEDIKKLKEECLKMEWGIFKYNEIMLERKRYNFLMDLPSLKGNEPEFVKKCHGQCMKVRRRFPSLYKEKKSLPNFIIERYNNKIRQAKNIIPLSLHSHQKQPILSMSINHGHSLVNEMNQPTNVLSQNLHEKKRPSLIAHSSPLGSNLDESNEEQYEEMPLTIATPRKRERFALFDSSLTIALAGPICRRSRSMSPSPSTLPNERMNIEKSPVICNIVNRGSVKEKDWQRITKVTQTPLSLCKSISESRIPLRQQNRANCRDKARTALFLNQNEFNNNAASSSKMPSNSVTTPPTSLRVIDDNFNVDGQQSPEPNIVKPIQPPSILKSDKKQSRLPALSAGEKPKIRFAQSLFTTEQIPSRAERANAERHDTSFTNFASLSASESSASSASAIQSGGNGTQIESADVSNASSVYFTTSNKANDERANQPMEEIGKANGVPIISFDEPVKIVVAKSNKPVQQTKPTLPDEQEKVEENGEDDVHQQKEKTPEPENKLEEEVEMQNDEDKVEMQNDEEEVEMQNDEEEEEEKASDEEEKDNNDLEEKETATGKEENLENSTTTKWLKANRREGMVLRRSTRARKTTEHFEPEPSPPRRSPSRIEKTPPIQEKTPPPNQTPPPSRKRGRPPSAAKKNKTPSPIPQTPKKRGRPSAARKDDQ